MADENVKHINIEDAEETAENENAAETAEKTKVADDTASEGAEETSEATDNVGGTEEESKEKSDAEKADDASDSVAQESERYMRLMAEFQNFKRRAAKEKSDIHAYANEKIIGDLLPVLDNFERALDAGTEDTQGYVKGMELIFTQLKTALENAGLSEIAALGEEFDPNVHNAVMTESSEEHEDGKVSKVLQKGYKLNDKVIRPSMVVVVRN